MSETVDLSQEIEEGIAITSATPENGLKVISQVDQNIAIMRDKYLSLAIQDAQDKAGFKLVHEARMTVKKARIEVDKARKYLNEDHQQAIKKNNETARRITSELQPIESHLLQQENWYEAERDRLVREELERKNMMIRRRVEIISSYGTRFDGISYILGDFRITHEDVAGFDEEEFDGEVHRLEAEYKRLQAIQLEEEQKVKAEKERIQKEAADLARQQEELRLERERLNKEKALLGLNVEVPIPPAPVKEVAIQAPPAEVVPDPIPAPPRVLPRADITALQSMHKALQAIREGFEFATHSLIELKEELDNDLRTWENKLEQAIRYEVDTL